MKKAFKTLLLALIIIPCVGLFAACGSLPFTSTPKAMSIEIISQPTKLVYEQDEKFNPTGMKIKVVLKDDAETTKTLDVKLSWVTGTALNKDKVLTLTGSQTLKITYGGQSVTFTVTVNAAAAG